MNTQNNLFKFSALSLAILTCNLIHAEESPAKQLEQLAPISVMASRGSNLQDMDMSTTVIEHEQIQNAPQSSIDQIINKIPGVFTPARLSTQLHPTSQLISIRGFGTSTNGLNLVLVDGIPANDPYFRTINWSQIPKEQVERIEVIRGGGATSLWGNMAMGGVINIVTRQPEQGSAIYASYGSFNTASYGASQGWELSEKFKIGLSYDGSQSDGYWQVPKRYRHPDMSKTESQVDTLNIKAIYSPNQQDEYLLALLASETKEEGLQYRDAENKWNTFRIAATGLTELSPDWKLNTLAWYQTNDMQTQNASIPGYSLATPNNGTSIISQKEKAEYDSFGTSLTANTQWKQLEDIKFGVDYRQIEVKDPLNIFNSTGFLGNITAEATHQFTGIFAQALYRPETLPLDITLGLRQDFWKASDAETYGQYAGSPIQNRLADQDENHFSPRLGFKYHFNNQLDLRGAAYKNFSAPGLNQMYRSFIGGSNYTVPNTDLKSQTNRGAELGFDFSDHALTLSGTYFYNKVKDYIDYAVVRSDCDAGNNYCDTGVSAAATLRQYVNAGDAKMQGFELIANVQVNDRISLNAGYTRTKSELTRSNLSVAVAPTGQQIGQIPTWNATWGASWQATDQLHLNVQLREFAEYWNNTAHTQLNEGALTVDLSANYQATPQLQLFAIAQNITDQSYYDQGLSYLADGSLNTSGSGTIPQYALPLNITIGAKYRF